MFNMHCTFESTWVNKFIQYVCSCDSACTLCMKQDYFGLKWDRDTRTKQDKLLSHDLDRVRHDARSPDDDDESVCEREC